ncbi:MAG TPA: hypothetical protein VFW33_17880 [Gemmataceae bacterium]|nr:hypothetical protein [Gemmataceae bacterium]
MGRSLRFASVLGVLLLAASAARAEKKEFSGLTYDQLNRYYNDLSEKGWTPVSVTGKAAGRESVYDMTWVDDKIGGWSMYVGLTPQEFQDKKEEMKKEGLDLAHESTWTVAGQERWAGVWVRKADGRGSWAHGKQDWKLEHSRGKVWEERGDGKVSHRYVEDRRTKEYVEMTDKDRGVSLRVYNDHVDRREGPKEEFKRLHDGGKWKEKER